MTSARPHRKKQPENQPAIEKLQVEGANSPFEKRCSARISMQHFQWGIFIAPVRDHTRARYGTNDQRVRGVSWVIGKCCCSERANASRETGKEEERRCSRHVLFAAPKTFQQVTRCTTVPHRLSRRSTKRLSVRPIFSGCGAFALLLVLLCHSPAHAAVKDANRGLVAKTPDLAPRSPRRRKNLRPSPQKTSE